jgi:XTP/dITP diphosphohydrolase
VSDALRLGPGSHSLLLATANRGKLRELEALLAPYALALRSLAELPGIELPPEGDDYARNASAKALVAARASDCAALGDDSGIELAALGGAPGPLSARFGGAGLDDAGRSQRLLDALARSGSPDRSARFVCVAAFATPAGEVTLARGECRGTILPAARGGAGFGYDPVFRPEGYDLSMAELPFELKNRISHRGRAIQALAPVLARAFGAAPAA